MRRKKEFDKAMEKAQVHTYLFETADISSGDRTRSIKLHDYIGPYYSKGEGGMHKNYHVKNKFKMMQVDMIFDDCL